MTDTVSMQRDEHGDWRPPNPLALAPINDWPLNLNRLARWFFCWPGYLWPYNALWLVVAVLTWLYLTPSLQSMQVIEAWWIGVLFARNSALILLLFGGLHLYLYVVRGQRDAYRFTTRSFAVGRRRFRFSHQVRDNMFHTLISGVPVFTAYEVFTYWGFANGYLGFGFFGDGATEGAATGLWIWTAVLVVIAPVIHSLHFYFGHRLLHTKLLYRRVHALHHRNVDIGPWSGLSMHPVEHLVYFSTAVVQWLLALHPISVLYQIQLAAFLPALSHCGFERVKLGERLSLDGGSHFHNLHHKHFEVNYGGSLIPLDRMFGSFHDGTTSGDALMRARIEARRQRLRQTKAVS